MRGKVEDRLAGGRVVSKERGGGLCRPIRPFTKPRVGGANSFSDAYRLGTLKTNGDHGTPIPTSALYTHVVGGGVRLYYFAFERSECGGGSALSLLGFRTFIWRLESGFHLAARRQRAYRN